MPIRKFIYYSYYYYYEKIVQIIHTYRIGLDTLLSGSEDTVKKNLQAGKMMLDKNYQLECIDIQTKEFIEI